MGRGIFEVGKKAAPHVVEAAKKAVKAAKSTVEYLTKQVQEAIDAREIAAEADKTFYKEREIKRKQKLDEALEDLRKRRSEQSNLG